MSVHAGPNTIKNNLVLHLDASNPKSYPGTGTTWFDVSGNGNNGTLTNMSVPSCYVRTYGGRAIQFDGANDYITVPSSSSLQITGAITISFWANITNNGVFSPLISKSSSGTNGEFEISADLRSGGTLAAWRPGISSDLANFFSSLTGSWSYYVFTCNGSAIGSTVTCYRNSALFGTITTNSSVRTASANPLTIGGRGSFYAPVFLDYIQIYNRILSLAEIRQNYNATRGRFGL
jgi:hypothetical protein